MNTDLFWAADWQGAYNYLTRGDFPLIFQLLAINTVAIVIMVVRGIISKHKLRATSAYIVQGILVAVNIAVILQNDTSMLINKML
jgi:hypothetical protein